MAVTGTAVMATRPDIARQARYWMASDGIGVPDLLQPLPDFVVTDPRPIRIALAGDVGTGDDVARRTAAAMDSSEASVEYDALVLLGDNVYPNGDPARLEETVFGPFGGVLDGDTRMLPVLGNHDIKDGHEAGHMAAIGMPGPWYATEIGGLLIVSLDSNRPRDTEQLAWLEETLAETSARWIIATMHHPPYSAGYHGSSMRVRSSFTPLFEKYGVQLAFSGHDHDYQRSTPIGGTTYVVSGGAATLRPANRGSFTEVAWSTYHFVDLAVWPDRIEGQAVDQNSQQFDSFTLTNPRPGVAEG